MYTHPPKFTCLIVTVMENGMFSFYLVIAVCTYKAWVLCHLIDLRLENKIEEK